MLSALGMGEGVYNRLWPWQCSQCIEYIVVCRCSTCAVVCSLLMVYSSEWCASWLAVRVHLSVHAHVAALLASAVQLYVVHTLIQQMARQLWSHAFYVACSSLPPFPSPLVLPSVQIFLDPLKTVKEQLLDGTLLYMHYTPLVHCHTHTFSRRRTCTMYLHLYSCVPVDHTIPFAC